MGPDHPLRMEEVDLLFFHYIYAVLASLIPWFMIEINDLHQSSRPIFGAWLGLGHSLVLCIILRQMDK